MGASPRQSSSIRPWEAIAATTSRHRVGPSRTDPRLKWCVPLVDNPIETWRPPPRQEPGRARRISSLQAHRKTEAEREHRAADHPDPRPNGEA